MMCEGRVRESYHPGQPARKILVCHFMISSQRPNVLSQLASTYFQHGPRPSTPMIKYMHTVSCRF